MYNKGQPHQALGADLLLTSCPQEVMNITGWHHRTPRQRFRRSRGALDMHKHPEIRQGTRLETKLHTQSDSRRYVALISRMSAGSRRRGARTNHRNHVEDAVVPERLLPAQAH